MWARRSFEKYIKDLNNVIQLPNGPNIKLISDQQYKSFIRLTTLMSKEELTNPQDITKSRISELATQSEVKEIHI